MIAPSAGTLTELEQIKKEMRAVATPEKAKASAWFFKTGPGGYAEGDQFIGVTVPEQRKIARAHYDLPLAGVIKLLQSPIHEERLTALIILVRQYQKGDAEQKKKIADLYLKYKAYVNNWDLVDSSAPHILGDSLLTHPSDLLERLAASKVIWDRRIAMIATFTFIRFGDPNESLKIAKILLGDRHDLIQKAVGWMLREYGKYHGRQALEAFLKDNYRQMGRTALRYAIEHFEPERRQEYLKGRV